MSLPESNSLSEFPKFLLLPYEIRQMIWDYSFDERSLTITPHRIYLPRAGLVCARAGESRHLARYGHELVATIFSAHLGIHPVLPTESQSPHPLDIRFRGCKIAYSNKGCSHKPPPGPVALHVHRESRGYALKSYSLAFGPSQKPLDHDPELALFFKSTPELCEARVWINFKLDRVFLNPGKTRFSSVIHPQFPVFLQNAPMEFQSIKKLAFPASWTDETISASPVLPSLLQPGMFLFNLSKFRTCEEITIFRLPLSDSDPKDTLTDLQLADEVVTQMRIRGRMMMETGDQSYHNWVDYTTKVVVSKDMILYEPNHTWIRKLRWRNPSDHQ